MRRAPLRAAFALGALALSLAFASSAFAQGEGFAANAFRPAPTVEDGFALQLPRTLGHLRPSFQLTLDYLHAPVVLGEKDGPDVGNIVDDSVYAHAYAALGLSDRFTLWVGIPVALFQDGDSPTAGPAAFGEPSVAGLGQPEVGGSARLLGKDDKGFQLGLAAALLIPTGNQGRDAFASDDGIGVRSRILAAYKAKLTPVANVGVAYRPKRDFGDTRLGTELTFGAGLHYAVIEPLTLMLEVFGSTGLRSDQAFSSLRTPLEGLLGARYTFEKGIVLGAAGSLGLTQAVGTPDVRALLSVGYAPPRPKPAPPAQPKAAPADPDSDGDGIPNSKDKCPNDPEDFDGFEDEDGCPDLDNDKDGIPDVKDKCPNDPETFNGFEDEDGCPDEKPEVRIEGGQVVMPDPIQFKFDSDVILPQSFPTLQKVADVLRDHPDVQLLSIEGHTSDEGTHEYNMDLSRRRARSVVKWLTQNGVDSKRLTSKGYGLTRPLVPNDSEKNRRLNRRVEFVIAKQDPGAAPAPVPASTNEAVKPAAPTESSEGAGSEEPAGKTRKNKKRPGKSEPKEK